MIRLTLRPLMAAVSTILALTPMAMQAGIDEQIDQVIETYKALPPQRTPALDPGVVKLLEEIDTNKMTPAQYMKLCETRLPGRTQPPLRDRFEAVGKQIADGDGADGAEAAVHHLQYIAHPGRRASRQAQIEYHNARMVATIAAAKHPGVPEAIKAGRATELLYLLYSVRDYKTLADEGIFKRVLPLLDDTFPAAKSGNLLAFFRVILNPSAGVDAAETQRVRKLLASKLEQASKLEELPERAREYYADKLKFANGAMARGELIDQKAPAMKVLWTRPEKAPSSMDALKGKIVVIDFWATWCGPCIAAFPHLAELTERYKDLPVEFIGATSPQEQLYDQTTKTMHKELTLDQETKLTGEWAEKMKVTWTLWMTEEDCFNPEYGVMGIPHVAIIGADGKVKHNGLSPHGTAVEDTLDQMLKEMGLTPPARPDPKEKEGQ